MWKYPGERAHTFDFEKIKKTTIEITKWMARRTAEMHNHIRFTHHTCEEVEWERRDFAKEIEIKALKVMIELNSLTAKSIQSNHRRVESGKLGKNGKEK